MSQNVCVFVEGSKTAIKAVDLLSHEREKSMVSLDWGSMRHIKDVELR